MKPHRIHLSDDWHFLHTPKGLQAKIGLVTAKRVDEIVHPFDRGTSRRRLQEHRDGRPVPGLERRVVREDGRVVHLFAQSQPAHNGAMATVETIVDPYEDTESSQLILRMASFCLKAGDVQRAAWCVADAMWLDRKLTWLHLERHFNHVLDQGPLSSVRQAAERRQLVDLAMRLEGLE